MYTVKQLANIAGITPRTLHYYDQIGLLSPSIVGDNGYRYYDDQSLLKLQQILLYREMEMPLAEIKKIMGRHDFDILDALEHHKQEINRRIGQLTLLQETVETTILYLKGKKKMTTDKLFTGFSDEQQAEYEKEAGRLYDPEVVKKSNMLWRSYSDAKKKEILDEAKQIYLDMAKAMSKGSGSAEAQACVERWRKNLDHFWAPSLEQLNGLAELYLQDDRFKANFDQIDPKLAEFFSEAIHEYVKRQK